MNSSQILEREFLEIRAKILSLAASLDRIDRADGDVSHEQNMINIRKGLEIACEKQPNRAERVQLLFSRDYQEHWAREYQLEARF